MQIETILTSPSFTCKAKAFGISNQSRERLIPGKKLTTASSPGVIQQNVLYAYLDDELYELLKNYAVRELLKTAMYRNLQITEEVRRETLHVNGWDWLECEACVADYFEILTKELYGINYSETQYRHVLAAKLKDRSKDSILLVHQNISAVLIEMGFPYISGYKPRFEYPTQLRDVVIAHLAAHQDDLPDLVPVHLDNFTPYESRWDEVLDLDLPERIPAISRPDRKFIGRIKNYSQQEANNRSLGRQGEQFVLEFERNRLKIAGREDLASEVEWSSDVSGDGLGFDVRSFSFDDSESNFREHFIEVKTTNSGKYQPFYITENELEFSKKSVDRYSLFRVYDFRKRPRIFQLPGAIDSHVNLQAESYLATFTTPI